MNYVVSFFCAAILLVIAWAGLDAGRHMWPKREHHPDDYIAALIIPIVAIGVGLFCLWAAAYVVLGAHAARGG